MPSSPSITRGPEMDLAVDCLVAFGANQGDRHGTFLKVLEGLGRYHVLDIQASSLIQTYPVGGPPGQDQYGNAVIRFRSRRPPREMAAALREIELECGRTRYVRWGPRTVDLDLLLYGQSLIHEPELDVPHPRMKIRRFVLEPACQVAHDWIHPECEIPLGGLYQAIRQATPRTALWLTSEPQKIAQLIERIDPSLFEPGFPGIQVIVGPESTGLEKMSRIAGDRDAAWASEVPPFRTNPTERPNQKRKQFEIRFGEWHILVASQNLQLVQNRWRPGMVLTERLEPNKDVGIEAQVNRYPGASVLLRGDERQVQFELLAALKSLDAFWIDS